MTVPMPPDPSTLRASHEDRERVAEALRVAAGDGRLTMDELEERLEVALSARTYSELESLLTDLPVQGALLPAPGVPGPGLPPQIAGAVKDVVHIKRRGGSVRQEGPWLVPKSLDIELRGGSILLDFIQARVSTQVTNVHVDLRGGSLRIFVPPGFAVDAAEVEIRGGSVRDRTRRSALPTPVPITHQIIVTGTIRGGSVVIRPPRRPRRGLFRRRLAALPPA